MLRDYLDKATELLQPDVSASELAHYLEDVGSFYNDEPSWYDNATTDEVMADFLKWREMEG